MRVAVPNESWPGESRVALVPAGKKLTALGLAYLAYGAHEEAYAAAGADVMSDST